MTRSMLAPNNFDIVDSRWQVIKSKIQLNITKLRH